MNVINYEAVEEPIKKIEHILGEYDVEEKQIILKFIQQRITKNIVRQKMNENLANMDMGIMGGVIKKFMRNKDKEEMLLEFTFQYFPFR